MARSPQILESYPPQAPSSLYALRELCASKLPTYRLRDVPRILLGLDETLMSAPSNMQAQEAATQQMTLASTEHGRTRSEIKTVVESLPVQPRRPLTYPNDNLQGLAAPTAQRPEEWKKDQPKNPVHSPKSITSTSTTTSSWIEAQRSTNTSDKSPSTVSHTSPSATESTESKPLIPPIRKFKMSRQSMQMEDDNTLRALEGYSARRPPRREQDEQTSDDSDLFLKVAKEEGLAQQASIVGGTTPSRLEHRRVSTLLFISCPTSPKFRAVVAKMPAPSLASVNPYPQITPCYHSVVG